MKERKQTMPRILAVGGAVLFLLQEVSFAHAQCVVSSPPVELGERASLEAPLVLNVRETQSAVGWVVPLRGAQEGGLHSDDAAAVVLDANGALSTVLDPERPHRSAGQYSNPIFRVTPVVRGGAFVVSEDRSRSTEPGTETISCGAHRAVLYETVTHRTRGLLTTEHLDATYACRVVAPEQPLVFGVHALLDRHRRLNGTAEFLAGTEDAATLTPLSWTLPLTLEDEREGFGARAALLEANNLEEPRAVRAGEHGWFVAFRFHRALYAGWIDPSLRAVGTLAQIGGNAEQGVPSLAWNGREVLLVHTSRPNREVPWRLAAERVAPRRTPGNTTNISVSAGRNEHVFAPAIAALPTGWALAYTVGPLQGNQRPRQHVWLATLEESLAVRATPVRVSSDDGGSDPQLVSRGTRVLAAFMGGQRPVRAVRSVVAECR